MDALKRRTPGIKALALRFNKLQSQLDQLKTSKPHAYGDKVVPEAIKVEDLFKLNLSEELWWDGSLDLEPQSDPPAWLSDEDVQEGIRFILQKDRAEEEIVCLRWEMMALHCSFLEKFLSVDQALDDCEGKGLTHQDPFLADLLHKILPFTSSSVKERSRF